MRGRIVATSGPRDVQLRRSVLLLLSRNGVFKHNGRTKFTLYKSQGLKPPNHHSKPPTKGFLISLAQMTLKKREVDRQKLRFGQQRPGLGVPRSVSPISASLAGHTLTALSGKLGNQPTKHIRSVAPISAPPLYPYISARDAQHHKSVEQMLRDLLGWYGTPEIGHQVPTESNCLVGTWAPEGQHFQTQTKNGEKQIWQCSKGRAASLFWSLSTCA